jgi:ketosteroid isomerase-like protein
VTDVTLGWEILHGMSQESVEFVRGGMEEFIRTGEFDPADFDDAFTFDNSNAMIDADTYRGLEGMNEFLSLMQQMWEQFRFEPEEYIPVSQDKVVVPWLITAVGRDGVETTAHAATVFTVRSGKLAHAKAFQSKADALEAAGPSD